MLKLTEVTKDYKVGGDIGYVHALKGLSIEFRSNEFVAILGPSGCGKTTLLNIIGGLDHYTDGDMSIDGISTKDYKDRDWDNYRNHRIGFVFQSYNLIPHQTVLQNVELALTIGGMSRDERRERAKEVLDRVGLAGEYDKKPNQLSGGQCQRVAIARAIVTDPEILLADEPTGALDTETSVQIMEIIKEISKDRLVIMVTHNPDLAARYATRTVRLLDGLIVGDSNPYEADADLPSGEEPDAKAKLSFTSAFRLSAQNLVSKAKRTSLVAIAASIGIIGVSAVLAVSSGVTGYIDSMESDMLSGNPLTVTTQGLDMNGIMSLMNGFQQAGAVVENVEDGYINVNETIASLVDSSSGNVNEFMFTNEITDDYVTYVQEMDKELYADIVFDYGFDASPNIFMASGLNGSTYEAEGNVASVSLIRAVYQEILDRIDDEIATYSDYVSMLPKPFDLFPNSEEMILSQYDIISGEDSHLPRNENELALVVSGDTSLSDLTLAQGGLLTQDQYVNTVKKAVKDEDYDPSLDIDRISIEDIMDKAYYYVPSDDIYYRMGESNWMYQGSGDILSYTGAMELHISCVLQRKDDVNYGCLSTGFYYTSALEERMREDAKNSAILAYLDQNDLEGFGTTDAIVMSYDWDFDGNSGTGYTALMSIDTTSLSSSITSVVNPTAILTMSKEALGGNETPKNISIYPSDFEQLDLIKEHLDIWNEEVDVTVGGRVLTYEERTPVQYTDTLSIIIAMVNSMVEIITTALVIFTSLSLVVSTVMIAVITYVSVIERIKEIGVIRSLGGRKKDVSRLFNAETVIIGLLAGGFGILVTYMLQIIINVAVGAVSGIYTIAALPWWMALIMVGISVLLTLVSGLVPARLAAKKDPVVALRSE